MWDCPACGCRNITAPLTRCPMCGRECDMPKVTVNSGASNANALPGETGYVLPAEPVADSGVEEPVKAVSEESPKGAPAPKLADSRKM